MNRGRRVNIGLVGVWATMGSVIVLAVCLFAVAPVWADTIVTSFGVQDTTHNDPSVRVQPINLPSLTGGTAPFDGVYIGNDISGPNFSADWTFTYTIPVAQSVTSGTFYLQIYDTDCAATTPHHPVGSFTINGVDLTSSLNDAFNSDAVGSTNFNMTGNLNKETVVLPGSLYASLGTGTANVHLALSGPGWGVLGSLPFNGAFLQYSELDLTTTANSVSEPTTMLFLSSCLLGLIGLRRKFKE